MKIYETLQKVLSPEDLASFKEEVETAIVTRTKENTKDLKTKSLADVSLRVEAQIEVIEEKAEEYVTMKIQEKSDALIKDYDAKLEILESNVVDSLDRFLDDEIAANISDKLIEDAAISSALLPLAEGMKKLMADNYITIDTEGSDKIAKLQDETTELKEQLSNEISEKLELSELAQNAASKLLVLQKTESLTIGQAKKVSAFFENKSFDEISKKIDGYITIINEDTDNSYAGAVPLSEAAADRGIDENKPKAPDAVESDMLTLASGYM